ncbi:uncharacterized protein [Phyllobates terribilis]|uniref:uncharacterized protein n=1 Tax=Phyllobates terribilis TaxID=111132 RepID=UPI003CCB07EB
MSAALEELLGKVRAAALTRGKDWQKVAEILADEGKATNTHDPMPPCTRTARPLEHKSPSPVPSAKRGVRSPRRNRPKAAPVVKSYVRYGVSCFRNVDFSADEILGMWSDKSSQCAASTATSVDGQKSREGHLEQHSYKSDAQPANVPVAAEGQAQQNDNSAEGDAEGPDTADSSSTAEESIELQIDRLLRTCSAETGFPLQHAPSAAAQDGIPGEQPKKDVKTIWIVGDSFVHWAEDRASECLYGTRLGLPRDKCNVFWFGRKGLYWDQMRKLIDTAARQTPSPDILILHAGAKDLTRMTSTILMQKVICGIRSLLFRWPGLKVIWSQIIQQRNRYYGKRRNKVNIGVEKFVKGKGGIVLHHEGINYKCPELYERDGIHLSDMGLDVFNSSLHDILEKYI